MELDANILNLSELSSEELKSLQAMGFTVSEQGSDEWYEERLGNATASQADAVMARVYKTKANPDGVPGKDYYRYMRVLATERLTGKRKRFSSGPIEWGKNREEEAADLYESFTGSDVRTSEFIKHPELAAGASPDRFVDEDGLLEIKCPNTDTHIEYMQEGYPEQYEWQMDWQLWITGRQWVDFMSFDPDMPENAQAYIKRHIRDESKMEEVEKGARKFLSEVERLEEWLNSYSYQS